MRLLGFREPVANPHNFCKAKKFCGFTTKEPQRKTKRETNAYAMLQKNRYPQTGTQIIWPAIMQAPYRFFAFPKRRTSGTSLHGQRKLCGNYPGWFSAKAIFSYLFFECHLPSNVTFRPHIEIPPIACARNVCHFKCLLHGAHITAGPVFLLFFYGSNSRGSVVSQNFPQITFRQITFFHNLFEKKYFTNASQKTII